MVGEDQILLETLLRLLGNLHCLETSLVLGCKSVVTPGKDNAGWWTWFMQML